VHLQDAPHKVLVCIAREQCLQTLEGFVSEERLQSKQCRMQRLGVFDPEGILLEEEIRADFNRDIQERARRTAHCSQQRVGKGTQTDPLALGLHPDWELKIELAQREPQTGFEGALTRLRSERVCAQYRATMAGDRLEVEHLLTVVAQLRQESGFSGTGATCHHSQPQLRREQR